MALGKRKVLVALDGSTQSLHTAQYAAKMLSPIGTEVVLFHVFSSIPESFWDLGDKTESDIWMNKLRDQEAEHQKAVKAFMEEARQVFLKASYREQFVSVEIHKRTKGIARDLAEEAKQGYDILMLGRAGTGPAKEFPVGSVATKILEVLPSLNLCVVSGNPETSSVLVALDGSEGSMKAVEFICSKLDRPSSEVILFHAMRSISFPETNRTQAGPFNEIEEEIWKEARAMIEPVMEKAKSRLMNAGFKAVTSKIVTGVASRAAALIEDAKKSRAGTILIGRKGISQVEDFNIGRVCNKVIYKAENMAVWIIA